MNRKAGARMTWLPVLGLVFLLFALPGGSAEARVASLTVTPGADQYGGTSAHWSVDGLPANQPAHLQRRGSLTAAWADVDDSFGIGATNSRGHLEFDFPTPAMNSVYFRVVTKGGGESEGHHFTSKHQDAELTLTEDAPAEVKLPLRGDGVAQAFVVNDESFTLKADTALLSDKNQRKPVLLGRGVTLQKRTVRGTVVVWTTVPGGTGTVGRDGFASFPNLMGGKNLSTGDYRVLLEHWTQNGDDIGEFPSFPFNVKAVDRPLAVLRPQSTAPSDTTVKLTWALPADTRDKIVIARNTNSPASLSQEIARVGGTVTSFTDAVSQTSTRSLTYNYALYSVSSDGIYTRIPATTSVTPPAPPPSGRGH